MPPPPYTFYRSDERALDDPTLVNGFEARVQLTVTEVRAVLDRCDGKSTADPTLDSRASWLQEWWGSAPKRLADLGMLIKTKVDSESIQVSTDTTVAGGGRGKQHLYEITVTDDLWLFTGAHDSAPIHNPASLSVVVGARIVANNQDLSKATLIGLLLIGDEVAFLTGIPRGLISEVTD